MIADKKLAWSVVALLAVHCVNRPLAAEEKPTPAPAGWDQIADPDGDCQFVSTITLTVPATNHDLSPRRGMNAPRLLKKVAGDFTAQVKVTSDFTPGVTSTGQGRPFIGAGLLVWENQDNFLRLERNAYWIADQLFCYPPLIEHWRSGQYAGVNSQPKPAHEFFQGRSTWLKLQRQGNRIIASFSHDGQDWTVAKEFEVEFADEVSVGIAALNTSDDAFTVEFESFKLTRDGDQTDPDQIDPTEQ
ncbi:MAG TPA: DUF1349 domain-containing protein [Pirellulales bacterium]|nr:DUF1349 domain-containing protein [Pirellulales bacterium]